MIQFVPAVVLTLLVGHTADRYDRRLIVRMAQTVYACAALMLTVALVAGVLSRDLLFAAVFMIGCARAFELPTTHSLMPMLVPERLLPRAVAAWTSANQFAIISGPAAGGLIYALSPTLVTGVCFVFFASPIAMVSLVKIERPVAAAQIADLCLGARGLRLYPQPQDAARRHHARSVRGHPRRRHRAAADLRARYSRTPARPGSACCARRPPVGAFLTTLVLSRLPIERGVGIKLFAVVAIYGLATMVFALSTYFPLSLLALALLGASDSVSVVVRFSLVQLETPDAMRGRVNAINYLFVGSSNTLGEFESGTVAAWLGAVPSALIGGIGSLLVAGLWMVLFPELRHVDRFGAGEKIRGARPDMHILITGAAGMIGRKLTARLVKDGELDGQTIDNLTLIDMVAPDRPAGFTGKVEIVTGDLAAPGAAEKAIAEPAGDDFPSRRRRVGRGGDEFRQRLSRQSRRHPRAAGSDPRRRTTSLRWCSPLRSRSMARRFRPPASPTTFHLTPLTSYGTQKAISELLLADYNRRGILDGVGIRLPTICVRPGKPNKAASGFFSSIIREPLAGLEAVLPVADTVRHTHASPRSAVGFLIHAAGLTREQLGPRISLAMPGVCCTVAEQIEALKRIAGAKVAARIRREPDELVMRIVAGWSERIVAQARGRARLQARRSSFDDIIRAHIEDELGGKIAN